MVRKNSLRDYPFRDAAAWPFGEALFNIEYDVMSDTTKARRFGFQEVVETEEMRMRMMEDLQELRFIPTP
jgi:hypothetical protein